MDQKNLSQFSCLKARLGYPPLGLWLSGEPLHACFFEFVGLSFFCDVCVNLVSQEPSGGGSAMRTVNDFQRCNIAKCLSIVGHETFG